MHIGVKRVYEPASGNNGYRVLADRMWPRGVAKRDAVLDEWCKSLAPSTRLRRWFGHDRSRWRVFAEAYREELDDRDPPLAESLRKEANDEGLTLLFAARDTECNNAVVLKTWLEDIQ